MKDFEEDNIFDLPSDEILKKIMSMFSDDEIVIKKLKEIEGFIYDKKLEELTKLEKYIENMYSYEDSVIVETYKESL